MKKKFLYVGLTSLFLLSCSKKVEDIEFNDIKDKIEKKDTFILVLASPSCAHCKELKESYKDSRYDFSYYEYNFLEMTDGLKKDEKEYIEAYQYFAKITDYAFSNIKSYFLDDTYSNYFKEYENVPEYSYGDLHGYDSYLEGYVNLVTPLSFFYIEGKLVNFEYGDYSSSLDIVMKKYEAAIEQGSSNITTSSSNNFNPYYYINDLTFEDLTTKIDNKEDFIFVLSSKNCSWCNRQFDDIYDNLYLNPVEFNFYYVDELFVDLELNDLGKPLNGKEKYEQAKKEYLYFASIIEKIGDFILGEEGAYIKDNYTERFGEKDPLLLYPSTFMYIDGEVSIELSYVGYGWTESSDSFVTFINMFNRLKDL